jgi:hypothetical protein
MINTVVEGESDRGLAKSVVAAAGREVGRIIVRGGKPKLDPQIPKYSQAAAHGLWVVFRDSDAECPAQLRSRLMAHIINPPPSFLLRIAHSMSESWLLADPDGFAGYFGVKRAQIPRSPETLPNAKEVVIRLCSESRSRSIRQDMAVGHRTGPLYVPRINEYATTRWNAETAAQNSDILRRALDRIRQLPTERAN